MSVKVVDRNLSRHEAVYNAVRLKEMMEELALRDFGIKDMTKIVRSKYIRGKEPEENLDKYLYLLQHCKERLYSISDDLVEDTRSAYKLYPKEKHDIYYDMKLKYMYKAFTDCEKLLSKLQNVTDTFDLDVNKLEQYTNAVTHEKNLILTWARAMKRKFR